MKTQTQTQTHQLSNSFSSDENKLFNQAINADLRYIDNEEFHQTNPHLKLFKNRIDMSDTELMWHKILISYSVYRTDKDVVDLQNHITNNADHIFQGDEEETIFLQMNYAKFVTYKLQQKYLNGKSLTSKETRRFLVWYQIYKECRNTIFVANLGLVFTILKRKLHFHKKKYEDETISEMNKALLNAVDKFDVSRGFKFSTYAWRAIQNRGQWYASKQFNRKEYAVDLDINLFDALVGQFNVDETKSDYLKHVRSLLYGENLHITQLNKKERLVLAYRFGFVLNSNFKNPHKGATLQDIGEELKLTKERVRQLEASGLRKLREYLEQE